MYLYFVATIRVYIGENGVIEPIPPALYRGEAPEYSRNSVWDLRVENGVVDAKQVATALQAKQLAKQKAEAILEEVENGTY